jgi:hypothetical protein
MNVKQWPNKLGWNIGRAEVRDCVSFLRAFVPLQSRRGFPDRHRRMDFPIGTDPIMAVMVCAQDGTIHEDS